MDFIERLLGTSPDGGSGSFELLLLTIAMVLVLISVALRPSIRRRRL